jgi:single-strand DNA-binding protein
MPNFCSVTLLGRCTDTPELKHIGSAKTPLCEVSMAINRVTKGSDGSKKEEVTFVSVTCWNRLAEIASQYLHKGDPAFFQGRLQTDSWTDQNGEKRSKLKVVAEDLQLLTGRPKADAPARQAPLGRPAPQPAATGSLEEDIPF